MTKLQLLNMLTEDLKEYRKLGITDSVIRNCNMNGYFDNFTEETALEAVLIDFINFVGARQGIDYGLYKHYLDKEDKKNVVE